MYRITRPSNGQFVMSNKDRRIRNLKSKRKLTHSMSCYFGIEKFEGLLTLRSPTNPSSSSSRYSTDQYYFREWNEHVLRTLRRRHVFFSRAKRECIRRSSDSMGLQRLWKIRSW
ncbi:hypothetical protein NPIL_13671 [Nephila pilipes]|uniref:Uncharacterized protein n=1 Tax=Nephila pilipes TaxID=299642 RepID=A0A8X6NA99_NEPPI|nr:hypothetical protein NPIL_13671 [Nephila pilipes]